MRRTALLVALVLAAGACGEQEDGGAEATESLVMESCAPGLVPLELEVCRCAYRELTDRFDDDALTRIDDQLRDDPENVPPAVQEIVLACGFDPVAPPATKPPTTTTNTTSTTATRPTSTTSTTERQSGGSGRSTTSTTDREP